MRVTQEFHYRLPNRVRGHRPGSHLGLTIGAGQEFVSHMNLYDRPDPRRLDLRASLRSLTGEWLVRVNRQRAGVSVYAVVDVSASMRFGAPPKLHVVGDFLESLGVSAFRTGDALGMLAFDTRERQDLFVPARLGRGVGSVMAANIRQAQGAESDGGVVGRGVGAIGRGVGVGGRGVVVGGDGAGRRVEGRGSEGAHRGLELAAARLAGREGLVFIVSDFHWPLERLAATLDVLVNALVVPLVVWDRAETEPPAANGFALVRDAETGAQRTLWLRPRLRTRWHEVVAERRAQLDRIFASKSVRPVYLEGKFDAEVLSKYFLEGGV